MTSGETGLSETDSEAPEVDSEEEEVVDSGTPDGVESALRFDGERPRNLLMLSIDTTRADAFRSGHSPRLDQLMAEGFELVDHVSCSNWTFVSVTCIQSGQRPVELGFVPISPVNGQVPPEVLLASEVLRDEGFQTALVSANPFFTTNGDLAQGFDLARDLSDSDDANSVITEGLAIADSLDPHRPWYLHLHFVDPHIHYSPPAEYLSELEGLDPIDYDLDAYFVYEQLASDYPDLPPEEQALIAEHARIRYMAELRYVDDQIALLLEELEASGMLDETLVVLWTDHGEELFDRGTIGHGDTLFREVNGAITAFHAPNLRVGQWAGPTTHVDIWPTTFEALSVDVPDSFLGTIAGQRPADSHRFALAYNGINTLQYVEREAVKLVYAWTGDKRLYRLGDDPLETEDVYDPKDPDVIELWELLGPEVEAVYALESVYEPVDPAP